MGEIECVCVRGDIRFCSFYLKVERGFPGVDSEILVMFLVVMINTGFRGTQRGAPYYRGCTTQVTLI